MYWWQSSPIICRRTARPSFKPAKVSISIARCWRAGSAPSARCCARWSLPFAATYWRPRSCMPTTRRSRCWHPAMAKPKRRACGPMCATTGQPATRRRRPFGLPTRPTARASIPNSLGQVRKRATSRCLRRFQRLVRRRHDPRSGLLGARATQIPRPARSARDAADHRGAAPDRRALCDRERDPGANHPTNEGKFDKPAHAHCSTIWSAGCAARSILYRESPTRRQQSCTRSSCGRRCCAIATTAPSRSITRRPNAPCVAWPSAAAITCSPAPTASASAPPRSTR